MTAPFTRTIHGAGSLDLRMVMEDEQPRVELVDRTTGSRHIWHPMDAGSLADLAMDTADMERCARYGGGS